MLQKTLQYKEMRRLSKQLKSDQSKRSPLSELNSDFNISNCPSIEINQLMQKVNYAIEQV